MSIPRRASNKSHETSALIAGIAAFTTWGLVPIYWKLLKAVPATEILAHRFVWTSIFLIALLTWQHRWTEVETNVRSQRGEPLLSGKWFDDRDHLVFVHLGGNHWARHRDESRLFHDAAHERSAWRGFPKGSGLGDGNSFPFCLEQ